MSDKWDHYSKYKFKLGLRTDGRFFNPGQYFDFRPIYLETIRLFYKSPKLNTIKVKQTCSN